MDDNDGIKETLVEIKASRKKLEWSYIQCIWIP